jgi:hypothetical protein
MIRLIARPKGNPVVRLVVTPVECPIMAPAVRPKATPTVRSKATLFVRQNENRPWTFLLLL